MGHIWHWDAIFAWRKYGRSCVWENNGDTKGAVNAANAAQTPFLCVDNTEMHLAATHAATESFGISATKSCSALSLVKFSARFCVTFELSGSKLGLGRLT